MSVTVSRRGTILGHTRLTVRGGTSRTAFVYLNLAGRVLVRRLRDTGTTTVRVTAVIRTAMAKRSVDHARGRQQKLAEAMPLQ